jgi:hypothetical protein
MARPRKHLEHCIERWEASTAAEQVARVGDFLLALATYQAACRRWPDARFILRRRGRVLEDSRAPSKSPITEPHRIR